MPNQFKLEFTLKQHTPLIHFQHDQEGATLRATELKPKLDKFLISKYKDEIDVFIKKTASGDEFLDYKVAVDTEDKKPVQIPSIDNFSAGNRESKISLVLANMGRGENDKTRFSFFEEITVSIICLNKSLKDIIEKYFCQFLLRTNFGNRQSKGFGSFYLAEHDKNYVTPHTTYHFEVSDSISIQLELFSNINLFWRSLRSGINNGTGKSFRTTFYFKSLMFAYAKSKSVQWEKKTIKSELFFDILEDQKDSRNNNDTLHFESKNKYLMKDMLGLSVQETWKSYSNAVLTKKHVVKDSSDNWINGEIERMKSPIMFKPIFNTQNNSVKVFVQVNKIPSKIRSEFFEVSNSISSKKVKIKFAPNEYYINDFFEFLFFHQNGNYSFDLEKHVDNNFKHELEWKTLKNIINQIRKNIKYA